MSCSNSSLKRWLPLGPLLILLVVLSACASPQVVESSSAPTSEVVDTTGEPGQQDPPTNVPAEEAAGGGSQSDGTFQVEAGYLDYCILSGDADLVADQFDKDGGFDDPVLLKQFMTDQLVRLELARSKVPVEIRDDFSTVIAGQYALDRKLADNNYDFVATMADPNALSSEYLEASERIEAFEQVNCFGADEEPTPGAEVALGDPDGPDDAEESAAGGLEGIELGEDDLAFFESLLATEAGRVLVAQTLAGLMEISEDQALCFIDNVDVAALARLGAAESVSQEAVIAEVMGALDLCGIPLSALERLATSIQN